MGDYFGGSSSKSKNWANSQSTSEGFNYAESQSFLDQQQQANQQQLFDQFQQQGYFPGTAQNTARLRDRVQGTYQGIGRNAQQGADRGRERFSQGMSGLAQRMTGDNPYISRQVEQLQDDMGRFYNEQIMPGLTSKFASGGQRGSSRHALAAGEAARGVAEEFGRGDTALRSHAYDQGLGASETMAGMGSQMYQGFNQQRGDFLGQQGTLGAGMNDQIQQMRLRPFQIGAGIAGAPSVLNESMGYGENRSQSTAESQGKSSSGSFKIGF